MESCSPLAAMVGGLVNERNTSCCISSRDGLLESQGMPVITYVYQASVQHCLYVGAVASCCVAEEYA